MSSARQVALAGLLALAAIGCRHATMPPVVQTQAPSINTAKAPAPPSGNPLSTQSTLPLPSLPPADEDASQHAPPLVVKTRHHKKTKAAPTTAAITTPPAVAPATAAPVSRDISPLPATPASPAATVPQATTTLPASAPSPTIGTLSTGDVSASTPARRKTVDLIGGTESGLNNIKRTLGTQEQQTALQIRSFLAKAKAALDADDLDGAQTLATKAKVLLDELTKQ